MNGWTSISPHRTRERAVLRPGSRCWSGKQQHEVVEERGAAAAKLGVVEAAEVDAADLGAERARDGADVDGTGDRHPTI